MWNFLLTKNNTLQVKIVAKKLWFKNVYNFQIFTASNEMQGFKWLPVKKLRISYVEVRVNHQPYLNLLLSSTSQVEEKIYNINYNYLKLIVLRFCSYEFLMKMLKYFYKYKFHFTLLMKIETAFWNEIFYEENDIL